VIPAVPGPKSSAPSCVIPYGGAKGIGYGISYRLTEAGASVLFVGLAVWLAFEAAASAWLGVWFNVGVDAAVTVLFAVPLLRR